MKKYLKLILIALIIIFCFACKNSMNQDNVSKGKTMVLNFESNPTTGFDWEYIIDGDNNDSIVLKNEEYISSNKNKDLMGAGGYKQYEFVGAKPGKFNIRFTYRRPWEGGESAYDVVYELEVDEKLNISCLNKKKGQIDSEKELSFFPDPSFSN